MTQETLPTPRNEFVDIALDVGPDANAVLSKMLAAQYAEKEPQLVRAALERFGKAWDNAELLDDFEVELFDPPYVRVIQTATGIRGTVLFVDSPRVYFYFCPSKATT